MAIRVDKTLSIFLTARVFKQILNNNETGILLFGKEKNNKNNYEGLHTMESCRKNGVFIIIALFLVTIPAGAVMEENPSTIISNSSDGDGSPVQMHDWITIDNLPIGTYTTGDSFTVSGKTGFPAGHEIFFGAYLSGFHTGTLDSQLPRYSGTTLVTQGTAGENWWSYSINTTQFKKTLRNQTIIRADAIAGEYTLSIESLSVRSPGRTVRYQYPFTLVERNTSLATSEIPAHANPIQNSPLSKRATPAPSTIILPVMALGILGFCYSKKRE